MLSGNQSSMTRVQATADIIALGREMAACEDLAELGLMAVTMGELLEVLDATPQ